VKKAFDVYFSGQLLEGREADEVKAAVGRLFKLSGARLEALFSGVPVRIKKNLTAEKAGRFRKTFLELGALVQIVPAGEEPPDPEPDPTPSPTVRMGRTSAATPPSDEAEGDGGLTLAPMASMAPADPPEPPQMDTSGLEMAAEGIHPSEPEQPVSPPPSDGGLTLAPLDGAPHEPPREIDTRIPDVSHLEAVPPDAEPNTTPEPEPSHLPDISGLRLETPDIESDGGSS